MLKIHQLFLTFFFITTTTLFCSLSFYLYQHEKSTALKRANANLDTIIELTYMSMKADDMSNLKIEDLSKKTNSHIGVLDNKLGKFAMSDKSIVSMDIFLGVQDFSKDPQTDSIDKTLVMYKALQKDLNGKIYTIVAAVNVDSVYTNLTPMFIKLFAIFIASLLFTYMIAKIFSKLLDKELAEIQHFLENISRKNYNITMKRSLIREFDTICLQLNDMKNSISKLDDKLTSRSAKIRLKNTQLESILSSISHEFKNPIAIIKASSQTLKNDKNMSNDDKNKFIDKITKNSDKMVNLIDKIKLTFASNNDIINSSEFELSEVSNEVAHELIDRYKNRKIIINGNAKILADKDLIRQVIQNLIENAIKYSSNDVFVDINEHSFYVIDTGIGISGENINLVTKRYFRVDENTWNSSFGLGLYIVKQILKAHNFRFIIESEFGKGSKFGFEF